MKKTISSILILLAVGLGFYLISIVLEDDKESVNQEINQELELDNQESAAEDEDQNKELAIEVLKEGSGQEAKNGDQLKVHYTGWLEDGTKFDSSLDRNMPFDLILGVGRVIEGWDQGLLGMKVGEKRRLTISPELGYGENQMGLIPPHSTLIFEVELLEINQE